MASTDLRFVDRVAHRAWLETQAALPRGFRVGVTRFGFTPIEVAKPAHMAMTLIALDQPTPAFAAMFTRNAFPAAPVLVGRRRLAEPSLGALLINNKVSNVCAPKGEAASERLCAEAGRLLDLPPTAVLPSSTGVIGWRLPVQAMIAALPQAVAGLQADSLLPAAEGICTTDLYPKLRRAALPGGGSLVGIAKGAGMIEPNMATMLVYLLTDAAIGRDELRAVLPVAVADSFNRISIDSDQSTSDTVVALASARAPHPGTAAFAQALRLVCADLAEDVVRNGEGVHHVLRIAVGGAPDEATALGVGKSVANSPLVQCAICGNDPNVGRLVMAIGKWLGLERPGLDPRCTRIAVEGHEVFADGAFLMDQQSEEALVASLRAAELYASMPPDAVGVFRPPIDFPPHERCVRINIDLGCGRASTTVLGADRSHEYISENADYRS